MGAAAGELSPTAYLRPTAPLSARAHSTHPSGPASAPGSPWCKPRETILMQSDWRTTWTLCDIGQMCCQQKYSHKKSRVNPIGIEFIARNLKREVHFQMLRSSKPQPDPRNSDTVLLSCRDSCCICCWVQVISHINDMIPVIWQWLPFFSHRHSPLHLNNISENTNVM